MQTRKGLGRGLESLLPPAQNKETDIGNDFNSLAVEKLKTIPIEKITTSRLQPRTTFDNEKIRELSESIKIDGIIQPLVVSPLPDGRYELIAGERRLRASRLAGLNEIPVIIKKVDQTTHLVISLIENIQREDLNPIEESQAFHDLVENCGLTQESVAKRVGKSRTAVTNSLRLLKLPQTIKEDLISNRYTSGHARALLSIDSIHEQLKLREWIINHTPTVRTVEEKISELKTNAPINENKTTDTEKSTSPQLNSIANKMKEILGTKVLIKANKKGGGKISIDFYSWQDLDRLYRTITEK